MNSFHDAAASRRNTAAAEPPRQRGLLALAIASIVAVPLLIAGLPGQALAQSSGGSSSAGGSSGGADNGPGSGPGGGGADGADIGIGTVAGVQTGSAPDINGMMGDQGERVIIIDVRPRTEFLKGHLMNARNMQVRHSAVLRDFVFDKAALGGDKSARIVVYGASASDPAAAAVVRQATAEGYSNVIWMRGGFAEWTAARLPTTQG